MTVVFLDLVLIIHYDPYFIWFLPFHNKFYQSLLIFPIIHLFIISFSKTFLEFFLLVFIIHISSSFIFLINFILTNWVFFR